jgi:hypothetical protein
MVGKKGRSGGARKRSVLKDNITFTVKISRQTADWLRSEALRRMPPGRSRPDTGALIEEIVNEHRRLVDELRRAEDNVP